MSTVMETTQPFYSPMDKCNFSTGYLEDALVEWNNRCKRRRLLYDDHDHTTTSEGILQNLNCFSDITNTSRMQDEDLHFSLGSISSGEKRAPEEATSASDTDNSSSSSYMDINKTSNTLIARDPPYSSACDLRASRRKFAKGVVYPFAVVKPGGFEGDVTLNDINERILMPPTRPVKHPVGDFASRPSISPDGPGLSGKDVVSFIRIQTQGRGTITIVRTRG
ncbi:hypothetical protein IFM89_020808 [Coptis chinensis]|uniref:Protein XRI1 n=1 Tax=Coptis chinensis TaxID=261450 RepID=A0A835MD36_9MAGN|nr:hypothetical protein IFM89_020808 [Coptis chinensis]